MSTHICHEDNSSCRCYSGGTEPSQDCPIHGSGPWPPKCDICGKFMPWKPVEEIQQGPMR